jgi:hypothetical protein
LAVTGCYGAPELQQTIQNHRYSPRSDAVAFAVSSRWVRQPKGILAFPDGGSPETVAEVGAVYICDVASVAVRRAWVAQRPSGFRPNFTPWLGIWSDAGLFVSLIDAASPDARRKEVQIGPGDVVTEIATAPPLTVAATSEPPACGTAVRRTMEADPPVGPAP